MNDVRKLTDALIASAVAAKRAEDAAAKLIVELEIAEMWAAR